MIPLTNDQRKFMSDYKLWGKKAIGTFRVANSSFLITSLTDNFSHTTVNIGDVLHIRDYSNVGGDFYANLNGSAEFYTTMNYHIKMYTEKK